MFDDRIWGCHSGRLLCVLGIIAMISVPVSYWYERPALTPPGDDPLPTTYATSTMQPPTRPVFLTRKKRHNPLQQDECLTRYRGISLNYTRGSDTTFQFDLCSVIWCSEEGSLWKEYDLYICDFPWGGPRTRPRETEWCPNWEHVMWGTGTHYQQKGYISKRTGVKSERTQKAGSFMRGAVTSGGKGGVNPLLLTIKGLEGNDYTRWVKDRSCNTGNNKTLYFILGVDHVGSDTMGLIAINFLDPPKDRLGPVTTTSQDPGIVVFNPDNLTATDLIRLSTGYEDKNLWLEWIAGTARQHNMTNCVACSSARPTLSTTPAPLPYDTDFSGFNCMLRLFMQANPTGYATFSELFPPVENKTLPPAFSPRVGNYTCLSRKNNNYVGDMPSHWCRITIDVNRWVNVSSLVWSRADLFWYCGTSVLRNYLPPDWSGTCSLIRLAMPILLMGVRGDQRASSTGRRPRRDLDWDLTGPTYMDEIGVPRGSPTSTS